MNASSSHTLFLSCGIGEHEAEERFRRKPWSWRFKHRGWKLRRRELIYLPVYVIGFESESGVSLNFAVDGREGRWCFLLPSTTSGDPAGTLLGRFILPAGEAREKARRTLSSLLVMRAFGRKGIGEVRETSVRRAGYPLWVEYHCKGDGKESGKEDGREIRYDLAILDGVRGNWAEDRVRLTLLMTLSSDSEREKFKESRR